MKHSILSFLFAAILVNPVFAQVHLNNYTSSANGFIMNLEFENESYNLEGKNGNIINFFNSVDEDKPGSPVLPTKTILIAIPPGSKISLNITNETFHFINNVFPRSNPGVDLGPDTSLVYHETQISSEYTNTNIYPGKEFFIEGYTWIRDYYCAVVKINTHRYDWKKRQLSELTSAEIAVHFYDEKPFAVNTFPAGEFDSDLDKFILNIDEVKNYRSFSPNITLDDSTGNWIDYTKEYVKLQIPDNGIYRIGYDELVNYGVNPLSLDPKTLKIFSKGKEIPLFVYGEDDNSFDPGDYIEFWTEKNYGFQNYRNLVGQGEDYLPYLDIYSDTSIVWLSWDGDNGERAELLNNYVLGLTDTVNSHLLKIHLESDLLLWYYGSDYPRIQLPFWNECKTWIWKQVTSSGTSSFTFAANSIVPNSSVYTITRLNSWFSDGVIHNAHKYGAKLNSTGIQDSVIFDFETIANLEAVFNSNDLIEGTNNYRVVGMPNDSARVHRAVLDWIDIEYYQYTNAINDSLLITIPDSVSLQQRVVKISNYNSDSASTIICKIGQQRKKITSFNLSGNILTFTDTVKGGDSYFVINNGYVKQPVFMEKKVFVNLRNTNLQADYIIISHKSLQQSAGDYANFIESNYPGINVQTAYVNDIYDEFGYGYLRPEPIKGFLEYAYFNWQSPKPSYLLLLGDCTYDYKNHFNISPAQLKHILVPSFGQPVSDSWYTMWDTANVNIQQMLVGRIPANDNDEVYKYLDKHQKYIQRDFDEWNKNFLLFSGGFPDNPSELTQIREANEKVLNNIIHPAPVGGEAVHFYKTISPPSNLGPYTTEEIRNALDYGGLFISYVGHSGTRTWDNGITEPSDIENEFNDRFPVITDNGCSTGKFAEPDIDAFGELFVSQDDHGQAIAYLGNSSLGYTSTAFRMPEIFYHKLIVDTTMSIGEAHFLAKMDNFNQYGYNDVNRVYNYCNILFGDPIIKFAFPDKPNFIVNQNSVRFDNEFITDDIDSVDIKIIVENEGRVTFDSLEIDIEGSYADTTTYSYHFYKPSPYFYDTLYLKIPLYGLAGEHKIKIELDRDNLTEETNENDNSAEISFVVYSTKLRPIESEYFYNSSRSNVKVLNPTIWANNLPNGIKLSISEDPDFANQMLTTKGFDSIATTLQLDNLQPDKRYYWRVSVDDNNNQWGKTVSFFNNYNYSWLINHSFKFLDVFEKHVEYDSTTLGWHIRTSPNYLKISSAGFNEGKYASIQYNYREYVPNTFIRGFGTALIDTFDLSPYNVQSFTTPVTPNRDSLINYLNSLPLGSVLAIAASDEVATFFSGAVGDSLKQIFREFGSVYVDSIAFRDSWAMLGIKGALQGSVPEAFTRNLSGHSAVVDSSKYVKFYEGAVYFPAAENSIKWLNVVKKDSLLPGTTINYYPIGYKNDGTADTLNMLQFISNKASIEIIDANVYKKISIFAELFANNNAETPEIKEIGINFVPPPELAINYQVVSVSSDSVQIGDNDTLKFFVYNPAYTKADSFKVRAEVINEDNTRDLLFEQVIDSLSAESRKYFQTVFNTSAGSGHKTFFITIDPDNKVAELFEDNNFFEIPFYVKPDTSTPNVTVTIDGGDILDGEYISSTPVIHAELFDYSLLPVTDPSSLMIYLNDELVPSDTSILSFEFSETNPKVVVDFTPTLKDGEYHLRVLGKNSNGEIIDSSGVERYFLVSNEARLLYVYNYPNPFKDETYFTFKLTQIPDEIRIKIFTVAGRLIKEIKLTPSSLKYDFNKISWDGKDANHDKLANGVYLYKIIMKAGNKTEDVIQKLVVMK